MRGLAFRRGQTLRQESPVKVALLLRKQDVGTGQRANRRLRRLAARGLHQTGMDLPGDLRDDRRFQLGPARKIAVKRGGCQAERRGQ